MLRKFITVTHARENLISKAKSPPEGTSADFFCQKAPSGGLIASPHHKRLSLLWLGEAISPIEGVFCAKKCAEAPSGGVFALELRFFLA